MAAADRIEDKTLILTLGSVAVILLPELRL
jgi:hypothetical protein